jgi:hypothetical protein
MAFAENLKQLPGISHLAAIELIDGEGTVVATIENKPGQEGPSRSTITWARPSAPLPPTRRRKA